MERSCRRDGRFSRAATRLLHPTRTNKLTEFTGHDGAVYAAAFSPDGKLVATGGYDKLVMIWNPDEVQPVDIAQAGSKASRTPKPNYLRLTGHDGPVRSVAFSPNGQLVASGSEDNAIRLWDVATGEVSQVLRGHGNAVRSVAFSPDGKCVLSGGQEKKDNQVRLWNLAGYQEVRVLHATVFAGHDDAVLSARFSPDGRADRHRQPRSHGQPVGRRLRQARCDSSKKVTSSWPPAPCSSPTAAGWPPAPATTRSASGTSRRHATGRAHADRPTRHARRFARRRLARHRQPRHRSPKFGTATPAQQSAHRSPATRPKSPPPPSRRTATCWPAATTAATSGSGARPVRPTQWTLAHELRGHSGSITAMRFTPDGQRLVSASGDHTCGQWDVATGAGDCASWC